MKQVYETPSIKVINCPFHITLLETSDETGGFVPDPENGGDD